MINHTRLQNMSYFNIPKYGGKPGQTIFVPSGAGHIGRNLVQTIYVLFTKKTGSPHVLFYHIFFLKKVQRVLIFVLINSNQWIIRKHIFYAYLYKFTLFIIHSNNYIPINLGINI